MYTSGGFSSHQANTMKASQFVQLQIDMKLTKRQALKIDQVLVEREEFNLDLPLVPETVTVETLDYTQDPVLIFLTKLASQNLKVWDIALQMNRSTSEIYRLVSAHNIRMNKTHNHQVNVPGILRLISAGRIPILSVCSKFNSSTPIVRDINNGVRTGMSSSQISLSQVYQSNLILEKSA